MAINLDHTGNVINTTDSNLTFQMTGALKLPAGSTAQQPTGISGHIRFNIDLNTFEGYNGTLWNEFSIDGHTHLSADITDATALNTPSVIVERDASGGFAAGQITASLIGIDYIAFDIAAAYEVLEGQIAWNADDGCLDIGLPNGVILQVGQEQHMHVKAVVAITDGDVVYASGAVGTSGKIEVDQFIADGSLPDLYVIGVATHDIAIGNFGYITTFGVVRGLVTDGSAVGETWIDGTILYASPTVAGQLTNVNPGSPGHTIVIAMVVASHATNGALFVRPDYGYHLTDLHDVDIAAVTTGEILKWSGTVWENNTLTEAGIIDWTIDQGATDIHVNNIPGGTGLVSISTTAPGVPADGDLWFNSETGAMYIRYTDITPDSYWVQVGGNDGEGGAAGGSSPFTDTGTYVYYGGALNVGIGTATPTEALHVIGNILASEDVTAYSDERLKTDINTIDNALNIVTQLRGVRYKKRATDRVSIGVIAQEVQNLLPEVVHVDDTGMLSVAYGNMVGLLIEAIKDQQTQINELKETVTMLIEKVTNGSN